MNFDFNEGSSNIAEVILGFIDGTKFEHNSEMDNKVKEYRKNLSKALTIISCEEKTRNGEEISRKELEHFLALKQSKTKEIPPSLKFRYNELLQKRDLTTDLAKIHRVEPEKIALDIVAIKPETTYVLCNGELARIEVDKITETERKYINIINAIKTGKELSKVDLAHLVYVATTMHPDNSFDDYRELDINKLKEIYNIPILPEYNNVCDIIRTEIRNFYGREHSRKAILESERDLKFDQAEFPEAYSDIEYEDYY